MRDLLCLFPHVGLVDDELLALAGEGELAGEIAVRVLIDDAANVARVETREGAVDHDLRNRGLTLFRLAAALEIDRVGKTLLGFGERRPLDAEPLGGEFFGRASSPVTSPLAATVVEPSVGALAGADASCGLSPGSRIAGSEPSTLLRKKKSLETRAITPCFGNSLSSRRTSVPARSGRTSSSSFGTPGSISSDIAMS